MKDLKLYENYSQYVEKKSLLDNNSVASTSDDDMVFFKPSYILTKNIVDVKTMYVIQPEGYSLESLNGEETTSSTFNLGNRTNENSVSFQDYMSSIPMAIEGSEYVEDYNNYTEGVRDVTLYQNWYCSCYESTDNIWIDKPFNHAKIVFQQEVDPSNVQLELMYESYNNGNSCENCLNVSYYNNFYPYLSELIDDGYVTTNDNITFEFVNGVNGYDNIDILALTINDMINYDNYKVSLNVWHEFYNENNGNNEWYFMPFSLIIDDVYTINYNNREKNTHIYKY